MDGEDIPLFGWADQYQCGRRSSDVHVVFLGHCSFCFVFGNHRFILDDNHISYRTAPRESRLCISEFHLHDGHLLDLLHTGDQTFELILGCTALRSPWKFITRLSCSLLYHVSNRGPQVEKAKGVFFEGKGLQLRGLSWPCLVVHRFLRPERGGACTRPNPGEPYIAVWKLERE